MTRFLITSGRGPAECRIAVAKVLDVISHDAAARGLDVDIAEGRNADGLGPASAIVVLHGAEADAFAEGWIGSIQWIARSPVRPLHKRKNWFIGVVALPPTPDVNIHLSESDVRFETFRAGGPGGQHQNKTESAVRAIHLPTGLSVVSRGERSQHRNKAVSLERLAALFGYAQELAKLSDSQNVQAAHDRLVRGQPVKRFQGEAFHPV